MSVSDTRERAARMYEAFHAKPSSRHVNFNFSWPSEMQEIGTASSEMYRSNKWQRDPNVFEDYKHIAEGEQTVYCKPGFIRDWANPRKPIEVVGPIVRFREPMPKHFSILAPLLGVQVNLYRKHPSGKLYVPQGDDSLYEIRVSRGMLGGAVHPGTGEPFLFVYTKDGGVCLMITGEKLNVKRDGIVG